jgi:hypothetical protein
VRATEPPLQKAGGALGLTVTVGSGLTVTIALALTVQLLASVTVTV